MEVAGFAVFLLSVGIIAGLSLLFKDRNIKKQLFLLTCLIVLFLITSRFYFHYQEMALLCIAMLAGAFAVYTFWKRRLQLKSLMHYRDFMSTLSEQRPNITSLESLGEAYARVLKRELHSEHCLVLLEASVSRRIITTAPSELRDIADVLYANSPDEFIIPVQSIAAIANIPYIFQEKLFHLASVHPKNIFYFFPVHLKNHRHGYICGISNLKDIDFIKSLLNLLCSDALANIFSLNLEHEKELTNKELGRRVALHTAQLKEKNKQLKKQERELREFYASITHDIRTPLSLITIPLEMILKESGNLSSRQLLNLQKMRMSVFKLIGMISNILDISKLESGKMSYSPSVYCLNTVLAGLSEVFRHAVESRGMQYKILIPRKKIFCELDIHKFEKVITNIVANALKYNRPRGKISLQLSVTSKNKARIDICDQGKGIPAGDLPNVFQRYYMAGNARSGTGIGLALARDYILMHNGKISVESRPGRITRFRIELPPVYPEPGFMEPPFETQFAEIFSIESLSQSKIISHNHELPVIAVFKAAEHDILVKELSAAYRVIPFLSIRDFLKAAVKNTFDLIIANEISEHEFFRIHELTLLRYTPTVLIDCQFSAPTCVNIDSGYHINELFSVIEKLLQEHSLRGELKKYYNELNHQIESAMELHRRFRSEPSKVLPEWIVWPYSKPAFRLAGDGVHFSMNSDRSLVFMMFDISGVGITPALLSLLVSNTFLNEKGMKTPEMLANKLKEVCLPYLKGHYISVFIAHIEPQHSKITWISAGHPNVIIKNGKRTSLLSRTGPALGLSRQLTSASLKTGIHPSEFKLLAFSHGFFSIKQQASPKSQNQNKNMSEEVFKNLLKQNNHGPGLLAEIEKNVQQNRNVQDDLNLFYIEYSGKKKPHR